MSPEEFEELMSYDFNKNDQYDYRAVSQTKSKPDLLKNVHEKIGDSQNLEKLMRQQGYFKNQSIDEQIWNDVVGDLSFEEFKKAFK